MSYGRMATCIDFIRSIPERDAAGFASISDDVIVSARAYMETRHGTEKWTNLASFSQATALFRFRRIPHVDITTEHAIICNGARYRILSIEDIRNRHMYIEALAEQIKPSMR